MAVVNLAVSLSDRSGEEHTQWLGLVAFGKVADSLLKHGKGDLLSASGRAQFNSYTTATGEAREQLQIIVDSIVSAKTARPGGKRRAREKDLVGASMANGDNGAPFDDPLQF